MHPLDNPTWHALNTLQAGAARIAEHARRFDPEVCVHGAFPDELSQSQTPEAWASLASFGREPVNLFTANPITPPAGWKITRTVDLIEMVQEASGFRTSDAENEHAGKLVDLTSVDLPQMSAIYEASRPGRKLYSRLIELGGFVGIKQGESLVAIACLRLNLAGYREISTVATLAGHTGKGYATALVGELARRSRNAAKQAFLTLSSNNARAYSIYKRLGFRPRTNLCSTTLRWEG